MAQVQPYRAAVVVQQSPGRGRPPLYRQLTFSQLNLECDRAARALQALGIRRGMRTVLMVPPSVEFFSVTFALFKIGAVPVLVDPGMGLGSLKTCLKEAKPEAFIGVAKAHLARTIFGWAKGELKLLITVGGASFLGGKSLNVTMAEEATERSVEPFPVAEVEGEETAAILFTSGSTGVPKGAVYRHEVFAQQVVLLREAFGIEAGEVDLATFPLFALFGPALGMTTIVPEMNASKPAEADPAKLVAAIQDYGATNMFGSPALVDKLSRYGEAHQIKLPSLRRVLSAGAPVRADVLARMRSLLSAGAQVHTPYGATEALPVCSIGSDELLQTSEDSAQGKGICVGRPVEGNLVRVIRIDDGPIESWSDELLLSEDQVGEIVVAGPTVTHRYFGRESSTQLAKIRDESGGRIFHRMGDLGRLDAEGRLWFYGRKAHRVELGTQTLFSVACESVFNVHPELRRSALVGISRGGERQALLCLELEPSVDAREKPRILKELRALGAAQPHTALISNFLFHPGFPVDVRHNAKIFREKLAVFAQAKFR